MMHGWGHGMRGFFGGGMIMMGLFWLVVIGLVIYLVKNNNNNSLNNQQRQIKLQEDPIEIAEKRYAKGEISKEELEEIKEELQS
ncbi:SHOCT domain-containing protein [Halanaerobaculum tunisiense]